MAFCSSSDVEWLVDTENHQTHIIGHWNYPPDTEVKPVYVVSTGEEVELFLNESLGKGNRDYNFLFTFDKVAFKPGKLEAVSYDKKEKN